MPPMEMDIANENRLTRLETKLDFLIAQIEKLPPSPTCIANHNNHEKRLGDIEAWRNRAIGAVLILNIVFIVALDKIKAFFTHSPLVGP